MCRRDFKLFARCLITAFVMLLFLACAGAAAAAIYTGGGGEIYRPVKIAVADNEDSAFSRVLVHAVRSTDFLSGLLETERMDEDEAIEAIADGEISAAVILPEGFVDDILHGEKSQGRIIIARGLASQREIVESIAKVGETLLLAGQNGVFCGEDLMDEYGVGWDVRSQYYERVNTDLLREALTANERYFVIEELDYCDTGVSESAYYAILWGTAFLLLISICFIPLFKTDCTPPLLQRLAVSGVGDRKFLMWKLTFSFLFRAVLIALALTAAVRLGLAGISAWTVISAVLTAAFVTLVGACLTLSFGNGIAGSFVLAVGGLVLCGGIVPRRLLPRAAVLVGDLSPFGAAKSLIAPAFGASPDAWGIAAALIYAAIALLLMRRTLRRTREGEIALEA